MKNELRLIDLTDAERGCVCLVCEAAPAAYRDRDCGPVCGDCLGAALRAENALRSVGLVEDEGLRAFAEIKRNLQAEAGE
jgi:hypothetical protein